MTNISDLVHNKIDTIPQIITKNSKQKENKIQFSFTTHPREVESTIKPEININTQTNPYPEQNFTTQTEN